jgi:MFS family permease
VTASALPTRSRLPQGLTSLRHRNFRLFWLGQLVSLIGTWMQTVAQGWLLVELTHADAVALGLLAATQFMPVLVFGLFGGVLADALPKRQGLIATQVISGVLALILGLLVLDKSVQVWHIFVLAGLLGLVNAFDMPIRQSFVVEMVGRADIANAVALNSAVFNGTRIVGPAVAGILIATLGLAACFLINAASYVAVIAGLLIMREEDLLRSPVSGLERSLRSVAGQLAEGLRYVRDTPTTFIAIAIVGVVSTAALNFVVLLPLLADRVLGGGATTYGFLSSAAGVGSLIGALSLAFGSAPSFRRLLAGAAAIGLAMIGLGISTWLPLSLVLMTVAGWGLIAMAATTNTIIQLNTPDHLRGRVVSVYTTVFAGSTPFGGVLSGTIAATAGTPAAFIVAGVVSLLAVAVAAFFRWNEVTSAAEFNSQAAVDPPTTTEPRGPSA